jgi:alginate O-acetyltransferase complex protein AlgI
MLFNSYVFLFAYLPVVVVVFFVLARFHHATAACFLTFASFFFYGWWNPAYVALLAASIVFNYSIGLAVSRLNARAQRQSAQILLAFGVTCDLVVLAYFKYANFFLSNIDAIAGTDWSWGRIILPLGISFFTFTQIAFLVDAYRGIAREYNPIHYALFVSYFPHLIAGPILHHKEMMPQFGAPATYKFSWENLAVASAIFTIGLFKKVVLADNISQYANTAFAASASGMQLTFLEAWGGALAYTLQLYFDFSGYSDMAIGLSRLFGVRLPLNFNSPYKATSIIEFWRRWHMTLSRFLRDYLYIPLGGNRRGTFRTYVNLLVTMLLGGLWHGAGWTFVIWGGLHGLYLAANHGWVVFRARLGTPSRFFTRTRPVFGWLLTFGAVVVGWVFFRASDLNTARRVLEGMAGLHGIVLPEAWQGSLGSYFIDPAKLAGIRFGPTAAFKGLTELFDLAVLCCIAFFFPNTQQFMAGFRPALQEVAQFAGRLSPLRWTPAFHWAFVVATLFLVALVQLTRVAEFLYFNF